MFIVGMKKPYSFKYQILNPKSLSWHEFFVFGIKALSMPSMSTRVHAFLDYFFSLFLMLAPALFGFGEAGAETIIPILVGMTICFYSFFTNYEGGLYPTFSMPVHYVFDLALGILVATSPWLFGFRSFVYKPHLFIGLAFVVISLTGLLPLISYKLRWHRHLPEFLRFN